MKIIKFKHLHLENYCKIKKIDVDISNDEVLITGHNEVGKTTVRMAIKDIFNLKNDTGKDITDIRPKDENSIVNNDADIVRNLTIIADDKNIELRKVTRNKRNKAGEVIGSVTDYYINDIGKTLKDYTEYINEHIAPPDELENCMNAFAFLSKDTAKRREILVKTFGELTDEEIAQKYSEFAPIKNMLADGTVRELIKMCRFRLNGNKDRQGLNTLLDEIAPKINEVERLKIDVDVAEQELAKNALLVQLTDLLNEQERVEEENKKVIEIKDKLLNLQFEQNERIRKANENLVKQKKALAEQIDEAKSQLSSRGTIEANILIYKNEISKLKKLFDEMAEQYAECKQKTFDETQAICSVCGQEYPESKKQEIKTQFEQNKQGTLNGIVENMNDVKKEIDRYSKKIDSEQAIINDSETKEQELKAQIESLTLKYDMLPETTDMSGDEEYTAIENRIQELKEQLKEIESIDTTELKNQIKRVNKELAQVEKKIAQSELNIKADERIEELQTEREKIVRQIAEVEKQMFLLKEFDRKKNELLQENINKHFEFIKFRMFEQQMNGDLKDVCTPLYNGISYDTTLNHGAKILVETDICRTFQKQANICMPIMIDDAESVDSWALPNIDNQMFIFERTDDKKMMINGKEI